MARVRSGLKQIKRGGPVVLKTTAKKGMRQLRCPGCHTMTKPTQVEMKLIYSCGCCGKQFTSQKM